ncbi:MAG: type II toxin-antitoxin system VapC family toxin [Acidobacteriota bacterium]
MIVVDTNVLVYAVRPGEQTDLALQALRRDPDWLAPEFWRLEMLNVLSLFVRVEGMERSAAGEAFAAAESLVEDLPMSSSADEVLRLTHQATISAYDAEFVLAAERLALPLVSADRQLARRVPRTVVSLERFATG